jgi:uncharacterized membrane protein YGL010W
VWHCESLLWACYFLGTAVAYTVAGVGHQLADKGNNVYYNDNKYAYIPILLVANFVLLYQGVSSLTESKLAKILLLLVNVAVMVVNFLFFRLMVLGVTLLVSSVFMVLVFLYHACHSGKKLSAAVKASTIVLLAAGLVIQVTLSGVCGNDGYRVCFKDCLLPNPMRFNHNALFHTIFAVGHLFQGVAEFQNPTGGSAEVHEDKSNEFCEGDVEPPS